MTPDTPVTWWMRVSVWLGQRWCGVTTGHYYLRQPDVDRVRLRCLHCDHASPGWR